MRCRPWPQVRGAGRVWGERGGRGGAARKGPSGVGAGAWLSCALPCTVFAHTTAFNGDVSGWNVAAVTSMQASAWQPPRPPSLWHWCTGCTQRSTREGRVPAWKLGPTRAREGWGPVASVRQEGSEVRPSGASLHTGRGLAVKRVRRAPCGGGEAGSRAGRRPRWLAAGGRARCCVPVSCESRACGGHGGECRGEKCVECAGRGECGWFAQRGSHGEC